MDRKKTAEQLDSEIAKAFGSRSIRAKYKQAAAIVDGRSTQLRELGAKAFPALVVLDLASLGDIA